MITIHDVEQGSPEWFALRENRWTGSVITYLLNGKPLPEVKHFTSKGTEHGKFFEQQALLAYRLETDREYMVVGFVTNSKYPNAGYSPDSISGEILLEVKCFYGKAWDDVKKGKIDVKVLAQIQFGLLICELEEAQLIIYNPKDKEQQLIIINIAKDRKIIANMRKKLKEAN